MPIRLALLAFPLLEIAAFIIVGRWIGVFPVLGLVLCAALAGTLILRTVGFSQVRSVHTANARDIVTALLPVADRALTIVAAMLLILPGFLSDTLALVLLVPPFRRWLIAAVAAKVQADVATHRNWPQGPDRGTVIEAEYIDLDAPTPPPPDRTPH